MARIASLFPSIGLRTKDREKGKREDSLESRRQKPEGKREREGKKHNTQEGKEEVGSVTKTLLKNSDGLPEVLQPGSYFPKVLGGGR